MKTYISLILALVLAGPALQAQINLIGATSNPTTGTIEVVRWQAFDSSSVTNYPTPLQGYLMGSSLFDSWNSNYYLTGYTASAAGLFSFNSQTSTQTFGNFSSFSNISEIDMSTGKIYTLIADTVGYIGVYEHDLATGTDSLIGFVYEPNTQGIIVDATAFDANEGILYYAGYDSTGQSCLFGMHVRAVPFYFTKTIMFPPSPAIFTGLQYDNMMNRLYALMTSFDSLWNPLPAVIAEIGTGNGEITEKVELAEFQGYLAGSSSYDQQTGSYLLVGVDTNFLFKMILYNTSGTTYQTGWVPNASEIVCDNYDFARSYYGTTGVTEKSDPQFSLYPVPAENYLTVSVGSHNGSALLQVFDLTGKERLAKELTTGPSRVSVQDLPAGFYITKISHTGGSWSGRLVVR